MTRLPVNVAAVQQHHDSEERRRAFMEEQPLQDTPDGANALDEDFGQFYDATEYHEGPEPTPWISDPSEWAVEDNDMNWVNSPTHSSDIVGRDGTITRFYDEHIELDNGLFWDQDIERNRGPRLTGHSERTHAYQAGQTEVLDHLNARWLSDNSRAASRIAKADAQDEGLLARKVKYFTNVIKLARALGITDKTRLHNLCIEGATKHHPEYLPC
jgi:hypothetical protein